MEDLKELPDLSKLTNIDSILIIKYFALGDIALSLPVVYALRETFPRANIDYLVWKRYADTLSGVDQLDEVIGMEEGVSAWIRMIARLKRRKYDLTLDLMSSPGSSLLTWFSSTEKSIGMDTGRHNWCFQHVLPRGFFRDRKRVKYYTLDANIRMINLLGMGRKEIGEGGDWERSDDRQLAIGFPASDSEKQWAEEYFMSLPQDGSGYAGITAGSNYRSKSWPEEFVIEVARRVYTEFDLIPVIIWGPGEEDVADRLKASVQVAVKPPPTGIPRLGALIEKLNILIGVDSGPKHLAVLQGIPTVTLFGPTDPLVWDPVTDMHRVLFRGLDCSPCRNSDCCPNLCMESITPDEVIETIRDVIR